MLKLSIPYLAYLLMSVIVILFAQYTHTIAAFAIKFYVYIDSHLDVLFSHSQTGLSLRHIVALVACPLILTGIPALIYRAIKHNPMPYFIEITWFVWGIIVLSNIL